MTSEKQFPQCWVLLSLLTFSLVAFTPRQSEAREYTHTIETIEINPFSLRNRRPDPIYDIRFKLEEGGWLLSGTFHSKLSPIIKFYHLPTPEYLTGFSFKSELSDPDAALDRLWVTCKNNGEFKPPTPNEFYEWLAKTFVKQECPKTDEWDSATLYELFSAPFPRGGHSAIDPNWVEAFGQRIDALSRHKMKLSAANANMDHHGETFVVSRKGKPILQFNIAAFSNGFICEKL